MKDGGSRTRPALALARAPSRARGRARARGARRPPAHAADPAGADGPSAVRGVRDPDDDARASRPKFARGLRRGSLRLAPPAEAIRRLFDRRRQRGPGHPASRIRPTVRSRVDRAVGDPPSAVARASPSDPGGPPRGGSPNTTMRRPHRSRAYSTHGTRSVSFVAAAGRRGGSAPSGDGPRARADPGAAFERRARRRRRGRRARRRARGDASARRAERRWTREGPNGPGPGRASNPRVTEASGGNPGRRPGVGEGVEDPRRGTGPGGVGFGALDASGASRRGRGPRRPRRWRRGGSSLPNARNATRARGRARRGSGRRRAAGCRRRRRASRTARQAAARSGPEPRRRPVEVVEAEGCPTTPRGSSSTSSARRASRRRGVQRARGRRRPGRRRPGRRRPGGEAFGRGVNRLYPTRDRRRAVAQVPIEANARREAPRAWTTSDDSQRETILGAPARFIIDSRFAARGGTGARRRSRGTLRAAMRVASAARRPEWLAPQPFPRRLRAGARGPGRVAALRRRRRGEPLRHARDLRAAHDGSFMETYGLHLGGDDRARDADVPPTRRRGRAGGGRPLGVVFEAVGDGQAALDMARGLSDAAAAPRSRSERGS